MINSADGRGRTLPLIVEQLKKTEENKNSH